MTAERPTNEEIDAMIEELNASFRRNVEDENEERDAEIPSGATCGTLEIAIR
jgi:hypothetical protein